MAKVYKDLGSTFTAHPVTGNLKVLSNADAVKQSVKNIILTNFYERHYAPKFGGNITSQLFELDSSFTEYNLTHNIKQAIKNYEPRATLDDVIVKSRGDNNTLDVTVEFRVENLTAPISLTVLLERVR